MCNSYYLTLAAWGLTMAAYKTELPISAYFLDFIKCFFAAFIVRASACTVNDIFDRKMDAGVGEPNYITYPHWEMLKSISLRKDQKQTIG